MHLCTIRLVNNWHFCIIYENLLYDTIMTKVVIIPLAHNYVSISGKLNEKFGGDQRVNPHLKAVEKSIEQVLNHQLPTIIIQDKAFSAAKNWPKFASLFEKFSKKQTITTYQALDWLNTANKDTAFNEHVFNKVEKDSQQIVFIVITCNNDLVRTFLEYTTNMSQDITEKVNDQNYPPQNGKIYMIDSEKNTIGYF